MKDFVYFKLDGCDISFLAKAPKDMTMEQFVKQSNRIKPDWCACGVVKADDDWDKEHIEIEFDYNDVKKLHTDVCCQIEELEGEKMNEQQECEILGILLELQKKLSSTIEALKYIKGTQHIQNPLIYCEELCGKVMDIIYDGE